MKSLSGRNKFSFRFAGNNFSLFVPVLFAPGVLTNWQKGEINRNKPVIFHKVLTFSRDQLAVWQVSHSFCPRAIQEFLVFLYLLSGFGYWVSGIALGIGNAHTCLGQRTSDIIVSRCLLPAHCFLIIVFGSLFAIFVWSSDSIVSTLIGEISTSYTEQRILKLRSPWKSVQETPLVLV